MHVDLVEALRCPRGHEDGWLVASVDVVRERRILHGTIACPACGGEWRVVDGELNLDGAMREVTASGAPPSTHVTPYAADALNIAALLDLRDSRGAVVLCGDAAFLADALASLTGVLVLVVNAPSGCATDHARLRAAHALPLGVGTMRGAYLDAAHSDGHWIDSAVRAVERGGRVVAPSHAPVPNDVQKLARDERVWVGEVKVAASGLVPLRRGGDPLREAT